MLSLLLSEPYFKHSDKKKDIDYKNINIVDPILGGHHFDIITSDFFLFYLWHQYL